MEPVFLGPGDATTFVITGPTVSSVVKLYAIEYPSAPAEFVDRQRK
jgi:hypothetical protein